ncbi:MAG: deoxynucleoside kinase [Patescibacteria group bacterium]
MIETRSQTVQKTEKEPQGKMTITVLGPSCSGKTTLLAHLRESGMTVHPEPDNEIFQLFIKNPHKFGYLNQLNLSTRLMALEAQNDASGNNSPHFIESGVLATDIYNRYLKDQGLITTEEFAHIDWMYRHHLSTHPKPDLVAYLTAADEDLKNRSVMRDGAVALEPNKLQPYWDRLVTEIQKNGVPVLKINTSIYSPVEANHMLLQQVKNI